MSEEKDFRAMRRFKQQLSQEECESILTKVYRACFTVIDEPVKEENDWWFHVKSVICFGKVSIIGDEDERTARLRQLGQKYFPDGYDLNAELMKNGAHVAVLDFKIEHITGKNVKEN